MSEEEPYQVRRLRELEAAAPVKHKRKNGPFVQIPLWWAEAATKATRGPKALVWVRLLYLAWRSRSRTVCLSNGWLEKRGVSRFTKNRALKELEVAGLIVVERQPRKSPRITVL